MLGMSSPCAPIVPLEDFLCRGVLTAEEISYCFRWVLLVPVERIELPTFGLQNRCSTAELNRRIEAIGEGEISRHLVRSSAGRISDLVAKGQNLKNRFSSLPHGKGGLSSRLFGNSISIALLTEMPGRPRR